MCDCSRLVDHSTSLRPLPGPIVYCTRVSSHTGTTNTARSETVQGVITHERVWYTRRTEAKIWKTHLPRRGMMCSPWETPLCCTGTRRRFSVLGKSAKTEAQVRDKLPGHAASFLLFTPRVSDFLSPKNESSWSTRILLFPSGPDTLWEAGLGSCSGEVEAAVELGEGKWRQQEIPTGGVLSYGWF